MRNVGAFMVADCTLAENVVHHRDKVFISKHSSLSFVASRRAATAAVL
jgi:hypothetical protein